MPLGGWMWLAEGVPLPHFCGQLILRRDIMVYWLWTITKNSCDA